MPTERQLREWPTLMQIAREYNLSPEDSILLLAIRDVEAGPKGFEMGVKAAKNTNLDEQARWTAGSIRANRKRYQGLQQEGFYMGSNRSVINGVFSIPKEALGRQGVILKDEIDFPEFMGYYGSPTGFGWAPIHGDMPKDEVKANKNWVGNVRKLTEKYTKLFKEKGVAFDGR